MAAVVRHAPVGANAFSRCDFPELERACNGAIGVLEQRGSEAAMEKETLIGACASCYLRVDRYLSSASRLK
jgi:hypothetical protein